VAGSISFFFSFFFLSFVGETKMATEGGQISLPWPLKWIVATPSGWIFFFFFFWFAGKVTEDGGGWRRLFARGGRLVTVGGSIWALGVLISF
jgi:hypothetical protein